MLSAEGNQNLLRECSKDEASYRRLLAAFGAPPMAPIYHLFNTLLPEMVIWIDTAGAIVYISEKCRDLLGYEAEGLRGSRWENLCHPDDRPSLPQLINLLSITAETQKIQQRLLHYNGSYLWVETTTCAVRNESTGEVEGLLGITHDITEQRLIETERKASEEKFFAAFHASPLPQFISTFDEGRIIEANQAFADLVGIGREAVLGHTTVELGIVVDLALRERLYAELRQTGSLREVEYQFRGSDGAVRTVLLSAERLEIHHQPCWLGMYYDITARKQAEAARIASERKFATLFDSNPIPMTLSDLSTTELIEVNPAFCRMIGLPSSRLRGFSTLELGLVVDPDTSEAFYRQAETQGSVHALEQRFRTHDSEIRMVLASAETIEVNGRAHLLSMFHDITERKQAEAALGVERQLLRTLIDNLPGFVYYKDTQARFLISNVANTQVLGLSSEDQALGKSDLDFYPPEIANQYYTDDMAVIQSGQPLINREEIGRDTAGNSRWVLTSKFPLRSRAGQIIGLVGIGIDITDRKQAEAALRASEERFHKAFGSSPFGMVIAELPSQRIVDANPMTLKIGQLSREEIIGQTAEAVGFVLEPAVQAEFNRQLMEAGRVRHLEASWTRQGQQTIVRVAAETIEIGGAPHLLVMFDDITALKQAEQEHIEKERLQTALDKEWELGDLKTRMMQRISHEFRTPLAVIQTSTGLILKYHDRLASDQREELTRRIEGQITSLTDMLSSISQIVRGEFQGLAFKPERVDLVALAQASIEYMQLMDHDNHPLHLETPASALEIMGDSRHLRSLLTNLLTNAVMYSAHNQPVVLGLTLDADSVCIRVTDEGIGILPEEIGRVTEPFFRGSNFDERPGLGLGMTNTKHVVELHQGTLHVKSYPHQGTTVEVRLPFEP